MRKEKCVRAWYFVVPMLRCCGFVAETRVLVLEEVQVLVSLGNGVSRDIANRTHYVLQNRTSNLLPTLDKALSLLTVLTAGRKVRKLKITPPFGWWILDTAR